jgi:hypothetical protein
MVGAEVTFAAYSFWKKKPFYNPHFNHRFLEMPYYLSLISDGFLP